jgi:hypothetical protein
MKSYPLSPETKEDVLCVLLNARTLIALEGWTQGAEARDSNGRKVSASYPKATCFCAEGANDEGAGDNFILSITTHNYLGCTLRLKRGLHIWNDRKGRTKAQVLAAYDKAIAKLEREIKAGK